MGQDFERNLSNAFNDYFKENRMDYSRGMPLGIAFRDTQHKYADQKLDIFVDNPYLGIECKKVKLSSSKKLYFSQHFSEKKVDGKEEKVHQVKAISDYLYRSGRKGFLAIRVSNGRGSPAEGYIIDWGYVKTLYYDSDEAGIDLRELEEMAENRGDIFKVPRPGSDWKITEELWNKMMLLV
jgi:hypothetical protein